MTTPFLNFLAVLAETSDDAIALPIFPLYETQSCERLYSLG
ncbi:hypothetical protein [Nostoc sp. FACHB-888]|nr:hypothetical protein [Nostoc sp. FACHB-888]